MKTSMYYYCFSAALYCCLNFVLLNQDLSSFETAVDPIQIIDHTVTQNHNKQWEQKHNKSTTIQPPH